MNTIGQKIKFYRERAKKSQMELEVEIGASTGSISRMEKGVVNPTKETLSKIASILKLNTLEISSLFDIDMNSILELMQLLSKVLSEKDQNKVIEIMTNDLAKKLDLKAISIFLVKDNKVQAKTFTQTWFSRAILNILPIKYSDISVDLNNQNNIIVKSINENKILETNDFLEIALPAISIDVAINIGMIINHKKSIVIPMTHENKKIGAVLFTQDKNDEFSFLLPILNIFSESLAKTLFV